MRTSVTELGDSRVRVEVGIEADAVEHRVERAAHQLARDMRMPGFRKGKVPAAARHPAGRTRGRARAGAPRLAARVVRARAPGHRDHPRRRPEAGRPVAAGRRRGALVLDRGRGAADGQLGEYRGLEVGRAEAEVPEDAVQAELDRLREGFASLDPVERPAAKGDLVVIDFSGTVDGEPFEGSDATRSDGRARRREPARRSSTGRSPARPPATS